MITRRQNAAAGFVLLFFCAAPAAAADDAVNTPANVAVQLNFTAAVHDADPFNDLELDVIFTAPGGRDIKVPAFWDGGDRWCVRFASPTPGDYPWRSVCSNPADTGLHNHRGLVHVTAYHGDNPLYQHGPLVVAPDHRHLQYRDGQPFFWLGDTQWMSLCKRLHWPDEFHRMIDDRRDKGYSVMQIVAGPYPEMTAFDPRGANEAGFPWEKGFTRINPAYYDMADRRIEYIVQQGITPCIVGAWGYYIPQMGPAKMRQHWRYLIARYGAMPVVWCLAGEANLPWYGDKGFPYDDREQVRKWTAVARYVRSIEPFGRLMSVHPTGLGQLSARGAIDDASLIDFDMLQTGHSDMQSLSPTVSTMRREYAATPPMPVLDSEVCYEGIAGRCDATVVRLMFWASILSGGCGHTYGANGIWQLNRRDQPYGRSGAGGNYGGPAWDDAIHLPGSTQLALAARLLRSLPWTKLKPADDLAALPHETIPANGQWIWSPQGNARRDAPVAPRYFRRTIDLHADAKAASLVIRAGCDDRCTVYWNAQPLGETRGWSPQRIFHVEPAAVRPGRNVIAVQGENLPAPVAANPAGLIIDATLHEADGSSLALGTDAKWRVSDQPADGWLRPDFDDAHWSAAAVIGHRGDAPWGAIADASAASPGPYAAQTDDDTLRLIYLAAPAPLQLHHLTPRRAYVAQWWDPTTGKTHTPIALQADPAGDASLAAPPMDHDALLILTPAAP